MKCDTCIKAGIIKGFDACKDCDEKRSIETCKEAEYSNCEMCGCNMKTAKMVRDWNGYICPECDEEDKKIS